MADMTSLHYDPAKIEDLGDGFRVVPPGIYNVVAVDSDLKTTKAGNGKVLELKLQIMEGPEVGVTLMDRLNLVNPSEMAQKIGLSQLKNICDAIGLKGQVRDSAQLHGKPFAVKVIVEEFESNREAGKMLKSNRIERRMARQTAGAAMAASAGAEQAKLAW